MGIQKKDNYSIVTMVMVATSFVFLSLPVWSFANTAAAAKALDNAYNIGHCVEPNAIQKVIVDFQSALKDCNDGNVVSRIRYELGMLYFKAHMVVQAKEQFLKIANTADGHSLINVFSLNMIGQISRMTGQDGDALNAFGQLVQMTQKTSEADNVTMMSPVVSKLMFSALFARAEIFESQKDYQNALLEYQRLLTVRGETIGGECHKCIPLARDRMSQLYLMNDKAEEYFKTAAVIVEQQPEYYRAPLIQFEIEAVRCLKNVKPESKFSKGSFAAPVELVTYLKDTKDKAVFKIVSDKLEVLCTTHKKTYSGIILNYHYAWLLDAMGEKDKAIKLFAEVAAAADPNRDVSPQIKTVIKTVCDYARVQCAIMYGESGDYSRSLKVLSGLSYDDNKTHLSNLARSVENSIETLKREVPKNDEKK
jgi:tetratricopeptide (TPR) repeat protein